MFFGLTNSLATFQTMMNTILRPVIVKGKVQVYMDDILVYTLTMKEHWELIRRVLKILKENKLFLKPEKCKFKKEQVDYLGVVISAKGVSVDPKKVEDIKMWPKLKKLVEVQEFIGFLNFYQRFIEGFLKIARLLHNLMKNVQYFYGQTNARQHSMNSRNGLHLLQYSLWLGMKVWWKSRQMLANTQSEGSCHKNKKEYLNLSLITPSH